LLHQGRIMYCDTPRKLKQGMPGAIIRITSANPRQLLEVVQALDGVDGVLLVGDGIHIHVDDAARRLPQLGQAIAASGLQANEIQQIEPTIEDLFVALLERKQQPT